MRLPFLIVLLVAGAAAFSVDIWLGFGLVLLFGRALLAGAHRRPALGRGALVGRGGAAPAGVGRGGGSDDEPGLVDLLPLP